MGATADLLLEIRGLRKTYGGGEQPALKGVDLSVGAQEMIGVLGLSGSGKSTLLRCINRLVVPDAGTIHLAGEEISGLTGRRLRRARRDVGMIFQEFNLVERLTVLENVLAGRLGFTSTWRCLTRAFHREDIDRALEICRRVGILDHVRKRADQLSGGQRQRVGIARALIQQPKILLVDEPTSSLDPKIGIEVMELMCGVAREAKVSMLVSIHDLSLARRFFDRIVGMRHGEKVLDARNADLDTEAINRIYDGPVG